jgi:hypothetical protein
MGSVLLGIKKMKTPRTYAELRLNVVKPDACHALRLVGQRASLSLQVDFEQQSIF